VVTTTTKITVQYAMVLQVLEAGMPTVLLYYKCITIYVIHCELKPSPPAITNIVQFVYKQMLNAHYHVNTSHDAASSSVRRSDELTAVVRLLADLSLLSRRLVLKRLTAVANLYHWRHR
jgi:hypothetical protein